MKGRSEFQETKFNYEVSWGGFSSAAKGNGIDNV